LLPLFTTIIAGLAFNKEYKHEQEVMKVFEMIGFTAKVAFTFRA